MKNWKAVALIMVLCGLISGPAVLAAEAQDAQKAVLVTGASSGIGLKITEYLSEAGYFVYAGARKDKDLERLDAMPNVQSVRLDVTVQEDIDAAVETIALAGRGLYGLVNNAGVAIIGPMMETSDEDFHFQMDVNLYGPFRVTKAFAPLIIEAQGRITIIGSISGTLSSSSLGAYSMTKHAMEAFTDALAGELGPQGVIVNIVEPGNFKSKISESAYQRLITEKIAAGEELTPAMQEFQERGPNDRSQYKEPDEVAAAVMLALFAENPHRRYMVVPSQEEAEWTIRKAMMELVQLNGDQPYAYSRDALVEMLDEAMATEAE